MNLKKIVRTPKTICGKQVKTNTKHGNLDLTSQNGVVDFLRAPTIKIAEFLTGILVSEQNDWKLSAGKLVQATIKGTLLTQLGREIEKYRNEGKIKEDYMITSKNRASLHELLKFHLLQQKHPNFECFRPYFRLWLSLFP
jgi:hypothetical protein